TTSHSIKEHQPKIKLPQSRSSDPTNINKARRYTPPLTYNSITNKPPRSDPSAMAFDESPSSPLDPHNPLASQQSRDAYLTARRRDTLEVPSGVEHLQLPPREREYPSEINLSDIPLSVAMRREPNTTPIGRWLQAVEPMSPTHDPALRPVSHWMNLPPTRTPPPGSRSFPSAPPTTSSSTAAISARQRASARPTLVTAPTMSSLAGPSNSHAFPASPSKKPTKMSPNEKSVRRLQGKKKHVPPPILTQRRIAVCKPTARKGMTSSQKPVLAPSGSAPRPRNQPIFCCPICGFRLPLLTAITQHIRDNHPRAYNSTNGHSNGPENESSEKLHDAVVLPPTPNPRHGCIALINNISVLGFITHIALRLKT
ncbi:hypothetical protein PSTT_16106, partial [Puccinia striiformis]